MPLKHERRCSSMYHSRADKAAAASVTPARAISCAQAEHLAPACAAQAREQEKQHVSQPSRQSRGGEHVSKPSRCSCRGERHACLGDQLCASRVASASLCCSSTRARAASCIEAERMKKRRRAPRLGRRSAAHERRAASASLCCSSTRARAASCIEAELMRQRRRASRLGWRSAAHEPSVERHSPWKPLTCANTKVWTR